MRVGTYPSGLAETIYWGEDASYVSLSSTVL